MGNKLIQQKSHRSVGRRLTALIIFFIVALSSAMMIIGYFRFKKSTEEYYYRMGETTAAIVALIVGTDSLDKYFKTRAKDEDYDKTMEILRKMRDKCGAKVLYVFTVADEGVIYIYDTDTLDASTELWKFDAFAYIDPDTGKADRLYPEAAEKQIRAGLKVDTIAGITQYGWIITVSEPIYDSDGRCKGYVGIDFNVDNVVNERTAYLLQFAAIIIIITAIFAALFLYVVRKTIIHPINIMAKAADSFLVNSLESGESIGESAILSIKIKTGDEMQSLAEALKSMVQKIHDYIISLKLATFKAETDALTTLFNKVAFEQRVNAILRLRPDKDQINAFLMIDVDYFKNVNDQYGHGAGDKVLLECAQALLRVTREADVVARLGGDEFAIFCRNISSVAKTEDKARQIRREWLKIIPPGGEKGITASIGISFAPHDGQGYQALFTKADEALYKAKAAGRDGFVTSHLPGQ